MNDVVTMASISSPEAEESQENLDSQDDCHICDLSEAIRNEDVEAVQQLLMQPAVCKVCQGEDVPYLQQAVIQGSLPIVQLLLQAGYDAAAQDAEGRTLLHLALQHEHQCLLGELYQHVPVAQQDVADSAGCTPLMYAISAGKIPLVEYLLQEGSCDVNATNHVRQTALHIATGLGHEGIMEALLRRGATVNRRDDPEVLHGDTCLHYVARLNLPSLVPLLLQYGANWTKINRHGENALYVAASRGHVKVVQQLLKAGILNVSTSDSDSEDDCPRKSGIESPLKSAAQNNHPGVVRMLLRHCNESSMTKALSSAVVAGATKAVAVILQGMSPILAESQAQHVALLAAHYGRTDTLRFLLQRGCTVGAVYTHFERTLLHEAAQQGRQEAADVLLEFGADLNATDSLGRSALLYALVNEHYEMAKYLLAHSVKVNQRDFVHNTPLLLAVKQEQEDIVEILLRKNCEVNVRDTVGRSPLMIACEKSLCKAVWMLTQQEANVNAMTSGGKSPLLIAVQNQQVPIIVHLMNAGNPLASPPLSLTSLIPCFRLLQQRSTHHHSMDILLCGRHHQGNSMRHIAWQALKLDCADGNVKRRETAMYRLLSNPAMLKQQCRIAIRQYLPMPICKAVVLLPLPNILQKYVIFHNFLVEDLL